MSIELLISMEWSRLQWDDSFADQIMLDTLLPKAEQRYLVHLDDNEENAIDANETQLAILWQPPHSELNGWFDGRPYEILKSYVAFGTLSNPDKTELNFDFTVHKVQRLLDLLHQCPLQQESPFELDISMWHDAVLKKARVGAYWYLAIFVSEQMFELLLSGNEQQLTINYYSRQSFPADYRSLIVNYPLNNEEHCVLQQLLIQATDITTHDPFPKNQLAGAMYW